MKHLIRFNESKEDELILTIKDCFAELIDDDLADVSMASDDSIKRVLVDLHLWKYSEEHFDSLEDMIENQKRKTDFLEDSKVAIDRIKDENRNVSCDYEIDDNENIFLYFYLSPVEIDEFYKKRGNNIFLNIQALKKILKLDDVEIKVWQNATGFNLSFGFTSEEHLLSHNKSEEDFFIIPHHNLDMIKISKNFNKLKIDGVPIIIRIESLGYSHDFTHDFTHDYTIQFSLTDKYKFATIIK